MKKRISFRLFVLFTVIALLFIHLDANPQIKEKKTTLIKKKPVFKLIDLKVTIKSCPKMVNPGQVVKLLIILENGGNVAAGKFSVDFVLSSNNVIPVKPAVYSPHFSDDVLLQGGRFTVKGLKAGGLIKMTVQGKIPADTPLGRYWLGVVADSGKKIAELRETNNVSQCPTVVGAKITLIMQDVLGKQHYEIWGKYFRDSQGTKKFFIGNYEANILSYSSSPPHWSDEYIGLLFPDDPVLGKPENFYIKKGGIIVSNVVKRPSHALLLKLVPDRVTFLSFSKPTIATIYGMWMGTNPNGYVVKVGTATATVLSLIGGADNEMKIRIPKLAKGVYKVTLFKNGFKAAREALTFTVY